MTEEQITKIEIFDSTVKRIKEIIQIQYHGDFDEMYRKESDVGSTFIDMLSHFDGDPVTYLESV